MSNDTQAAAASASTAASAADDAAATVDAIVKRLNANRANTLALCAVLSVCERRMPYRDAEALIDERPELSLSTQNAHALLRIMVDCGGVDAVEVPEPAYAPGEEKQDRPIDYTVQTTAAGRAALERFEPTKRFGDVLRDEPAAYAQTYVAVLACCAENGGATKAAIERALEGDSALSDPKQVYPSYFISKLETVGGLAWDGSWKTTDAGRQMLAMVG